MKTVFPAPLSFIVKLCGGVAAVSGPLTPDLAVDGDRLMIETVGEDSDKDPFAGELRRLRQIQLSCFAESGTAADILMSGINHYPVFFQELQKLLMVGCIPDPEDRFVVDAGGLKKMIMGTDNELFAFFNRFSDQSGIFIPEFSA